MNTNKPENDQRAGFPLSDGLGGHHPMATERPKPNGVDCPNCRAVLLDTMPNESLLSAPPSKRVHCAECGYKGYRAA